MAEPTTKQTDAAAPEAGPDLLDEMVEASRLKPGESGYSATKSGLRAFLARFVKTGSAAKVSGALVDDMIADLDRKISAQVNAVMHHASFKKLEAGWRNLKFLVDRTNFRQNNRIQIVNVSKEDLLADFEDAPEVVKSGLYKHVCTAEYGQFGGRPFGAVIADYDFGPGPEDLKLPRHAASVSSMSHAPFVAAADQSFFGLESWEDLPNLKDIRSVFETPRYAAWRSFRASEDARHVGLTLPKLLLRLPYGPETVPAETFDFVEESGQTSDLLWGNTSFAFASRLTDSYAKHRFCADVIGPKSGGTVENLPLCRYSENGAAKTRVPTQTLVSERRECELAEEGFIPLAMRKDSDNAAFFSANSCMAVKSFPKTPEGRKAETDHRLSAQLPHMMIMNRLAHYVKVIQRENIGTWKDRGELERELNKWLGRHATGMDSPDPATRSRRPLRMARIEVKDVEDDPGWYSVAIKARPHFKYMGADFTLSLVGKLDKT